MKKDSSSDVHELRRQVHDLQKTVATMSMMLKCFDEGLTRVQAAVKVLQQQEIMRTSPENVARAMLQVEELTDAVIAVSGIGKTQQQLTRLLDRLPKISTPVPAATIRET